MEIDIKQILKTIPHRHPFLFIDSIKSIEQTDHEKKIGSKIHAVKNVTINEDFFRGHYPGEPVMPGVLQMEAMAQAGAFLKIYPDTWEDYSDLLVAKAGNTYFRKKIVPGDVLDIHVTLKKAVKNMSFFEGKILVDGQEACSGEMCAVIS